MRQVLFIILFIIGMIAGAQTLSGFDSDDSAAFTNLSLYPQNIRQSILESCRHPEAILKIQDLQKKSSKKFQALLSDYFKSEQEKFWELSRQPGLIEKIVTGGHKSKSELQEIASAYPPELKETIISYGDRFFVDLEEIRKLEKKSDSEFNDLIKNYSSVSQDAFREIIKHPELIGLLCDNMRVTVMLGDLYNTRKEYLNNKMDSVSLVNAEQKAKELEDWKKGLENNPEAKSEMLQAAKEFSKDQGKKDDDYSAPANVNINYYVNPYPYWFGYPWWYSYPYWYPYPYWYDWGFYVGPSGFVYIGMPSPFFTHWYFTHHYHHYYYNHFSDYCISHYYGHRTSHGGFNKEVRTWTRVNEKQLPKEFLNNDGGRLQRFKKLGESQKDAPLNRPQRKVYSNDDYKIINTRPSKPTQPMQPGKQMPSTKPGRSTFPSNPQAPRGKGRG